MVIFTFSMYYFFKIEIENESIFILKHSYIFGSDITDINNCIVCDVNKDHIVARFL